MSSLNVSPYVRDGAALAYDAALGEMILFGGQDESSHQVGHALDNDTRGLSGTNLSSLAWTQIHTVTSPPHVDLLSMVHDTPRKGVLIFGGVGATPRGLPKATLYGYNGTRVLE